MVGTVIVQECLLQGRRIKKNYEFLKITYESLLLGISEAKPGKHIGDIGNKIQKLAEGKGYSVVRDFCGHGIGKDFILHLVFYTLENQVKDQC